MTPEVTVVVPTWKSAAFVGETLDSIRAQDFEDYTVVVSVDPSPDETLDVCLDYADGDSRFRIHEQTHRGGWIGNSNRALDLVDTPLFMYMPHDDILPTNYLSSLRAALERHPEAVCTYPDMERFQNISARGHVDSLVGSPSERAVAWLQGRLSSIPFRGLTRRSVLDSGLRLIEGPVDGMHADVLWVLEVALMGDCLRVPEAVYRKRVRDGSVVRGWESTPLESKRIGMVFHITEVAEAVARAGLSPTDQEQVLWAAIRRVDRVPEHWRPFRDPDERALFHAQLLMSIRNRDCGLTRPDIGGVTER